MTAYAPIEVGCEAYIVRENKLLLGKRKNTFGAGTWGLPGGRIELMERADGAIIRELQEELGLKIGLDDISFLALTDDPQPEAGVHHLHVTFEVKIRGQEPVNAEPHTCEELRWFPLYDLPKDIFPPHKRIFTTIESGRHYARAESRYKRAGRASK